MAEDFTLKGKVVLDTSGLAQPTQDTKGLTSEFTNLFGGLSSTTVAMGAVSAAAVGLAAGIVSLTDAAYEAYCEYDRLGYTIGATAGEMAKWNKVAIYADSSAQSLATMLGKLSVNISDVGPGGEKARQILEDMGVAVYDVEGNIRPLTEIFPEMIGGLERTTNAAERNGKAMDLVGRGYKDLAGYMILGQEGIEEVYNRSGSLSEKQQADLGALEDRWKDLNGTMGKTKTVLGAELAPAVYEVVDAIDTLMKIDNGKFFKEIVEGVELAVDAFKVLVRGITLTIIALEYLNAMTHGDFAGAEAIRQRGAAYVESYQAKDKEDDFNTAWDAAGGKTTRGGGGAGTASSSSKASAGTGETPAAKFGASAYSDKEIGEMATRLGIPVDAVVARLNLAGEANKYGVSTSQLTGSKYVATSAGQMSESDITMYNDLQASFSGQSGRNEGYYTGVYAENTARYNANLKFAQADTTGDKNLAAIRNLETHMFNPVNNARLNENYGYGSGTFASTSDEYMANYMKQFAAPTVNIVNYNYGSSSPEEIANATAEATSRELARQAAL